MNVSWVKLILEEARGFIVGYTITYNSIEAHLRRDVRMEMVHPDSSYKVIGGLGFTESYSVTVSASTVAGEGLSSFMTLSHGKHVGYKLFKLKHSALFCNSSTILCLPIENYWNKRVLSVEGKPV